MSSIRASAVAKRARRLSMILLASAIATRLVALEPQPVDGDATAQALDVLLEALDEEEDG